MLLGETMIDRIQEEIDVWQKRRDVIHSDLEKFAVELSATSQVALIKEVAIIDAHIKDMRDELADMQWQSIVSDYHKKNVDE
jgi:hypothetical protein